MNRKLQFGVATAQNVPWQKMVERWRYIEELGFDSVSVADHFVFFTHPNMPWFEAWTLPASLAPQTTRIRIGLLAQIMSTVFRVEKQFDTLVRMIEEEAAQEGAREPYHVTNSSM